MADEELTVGRLKAFLADVPDDYLVVSFDGEENFGICGEPELCRFMPARPSQLLPPADAPHEPLKGIFNAVSIS